MALIHDMDVDEYLRKSVSIEPLALSEEFVQLSADLAYWGARFADALREFLRAKHSLEKTEARLWIECREALLAQARAQTPPVVAATPPEPVDPTAAPPRRRAAAPRQPAPERVTEGQIEAAVATHADYEAAKQTMIEAEVEKARLYGVVDAVRAKREMLVSLGAQVRAEMEHDPSIRKQHADAREIRGQFREP